MSTFEDWLEAQGDDRQLADLDWICCDVVKVKRKEMVCANCVHKVRACRPSHLEIDTPEVDWCYLWKHEIEAPDFYCKSWKEKE